MRAKKQAKQGDEVTCKGVSDEDLGEEKPRRS